MQIKLLNQNTREPKLIYTSKAFAKLIDYLNTTHAKTYEFGFMGLVEKREDNYIVQDVEIHPQLCKTAFYETDDAKFPEWLNTTYPRPDQRKLIRLQGHSHVNMQTSPSGTDEEQILKLVDQVQDYYIQLIINQKLVNTCNIYSKELNLIYTNVSEYVIMNDEVLVKIDKQLNIINLQDCLKEPRINKDTQEIKFSSGISLKLDSIQPYYIISDEYLSINTFDKTITSNTNIDYNKEMNKMCKINTYVSSNSIFPYKQGKSILDDDDYYEDDYSYPYPYGSFDAYGNKTYPKTNKSSKPVKKGK